MHFALVSEAAGADFSELVAIAQAVERQIEEHVAPVWKVAGTVTAYPQLSQAPPDSTPILIGDKFTFASLGVHLHRADDDRPFALLKTQPDVSVAISHEIIEILVDPIGDRVVAAPSIKPGQGSVEYLLEVCDPPEDCSYELDGIKVSDFCTPAYYDASSHPGVAFSYTRAVSRPFEVLPKGYVSWHEPVTGAWWQLRRSAEGDGEFHTLDGIGAPAVGTRAQVDHAMQRVYEAEGAGQPAQAQPDAGQPMQPFAAQDPREASLRELIDALQRGGTYPP